MARTIHRRTSRIRRTSLRRKTSRLRKKANRTTSSICKQRRELLQARLGSWSNFNLGPGKRRAAGEFAQSCISDVLQVLDADFARVEAVAGEPAQEGEKGYPLAQRWVLFRVLAECDQVQQLFALFRSAIQKHTGITVGAETVQPL